MSSKKLAKNHCVINSVQLLTEAEPVPEPLTAGAAALALAGLSWLKPGGVTTRPKLIVSKD